MTKERIERNLIEDDPSSKVVNLSFEDHYTVNRQSAYNKALILEAGKCGCFYCGSTWNADDIEEWIEEGDGDETGICPFCGKDTLIAGTKEFPLTTSLLSQMYVQWFLKQSNLQWDFVRYQDKYTPADEECLRAGIVFLVAADSL